MRYDIQENHPIQGGWAEYDVDGGTISYRGTIDVKLGFFPISKDFDGSYSTDPVNLNSSNYTTIGAQQKIDKVNLVVMEVVDQTSRLGVTTDDGNVSGSVWVDVSQPQIVLQSADITVTSLGMDLTIALR